MRIQAFLFGFVVLALAACQAVKVDPAAETLSRAMFDDLRLGRAEALHARLPPKFQVQPGFDQILALRQYVPRSEPRSAKLLSSRLIESKGQGRAEQVALEYDYGDRTILFRTSFLQPQGAKDWSLTGVNLATATAQELAANRFTLSKPLPQLLFLAYSVLSPFLMIAALLKVVFTSGLKYKWLWIVPCFVGVFTLRMNWTTGLFLVNWLSVQLVGFGISSSGSKFDPWFVTATLPIGALLVLGGLWANPLVARKTSV